MQEKLYSKTIINKLKEINSGINQINNKHQDYFTLISSNKYRVHLKQFYIIEYDNNTIKIQKRKSHTNLRQDIHEEFINYLMNIDINWIEEK